MTKNNTPALRFDGFGGEWDRRELNQIGIKSTTTNADAALTETFTNSAQYGVISQLEYFDHAVSKPASISKYSVVEPDDFVYNPRISVTAPFGPINRNRLSRSGAMSPLYLVFKVFGVDHGFLEQFFKTDLWHDFMRLNGDVGARHDRFSIGDAKFMEMEIPTPLLDEQRAIGEFFADLDALIEQHRAKHTNLQQTKTALLQRMFPQDDADEPELRLDGFSRHWKQSSFGDVVESFKYGVNAAATEYDGVTKYLRITDLDESSGQFGTGLVTSPRAEEKTIRDFLLEEGDMVFARTGATVGRSYLFRKSVGRTVWAGFLIRARFKRNTDPQFVAAYAQTDSYWTYVKLTSQRSGQPGLNSSEYAAMPLAIPPSLEEQRAIGEVFSNLDALIAAESRYITQLTQAKTALLQRMFV